MMKIYLAPLEGITGWIYRNALRECFGGFDKYFIPFIRPNQMGHLSSREKKDVLPEHNSGMYAVPQILTNRADDFIRTARKLQEYGYSEVNLNLGCPSRTVVTKGRGAGFLADPDRLDRFLDEVFSSCTVKISVKTRTGLEDAEEFERILDIYGRYPLEELIVHPRVQKDFYRNRPDWESFRKAAEDWKGRVCYNGDLFCPDDVIRFCRSFPDVDRIMTGRGVLADPSLGRQLRGGTPASAEELRRFHDLLYEGYKEEMSGDRTILYKMKEIWSYMAPLFVNGAKYAKKIRKAERCSVYEKITEELFASERIRQNSDRRNQ